MKLIEELKKRFTKNGEHRKKLNNLKVLKIRYPESIDLKIMIKIFRQKIYGMKGNNFIIEQMVKLFENRFPFYNQVVEVEGIKFDLTSTVSLRPIFLRELIDLLMCDLYFSKSKEFEEFYQIMQKAINGEGPYQSQPVILNPQDVVIDCGANMGMFSLLSNKFYNCKCYAFEPIASTIDMLKNNIILNRMEEDIAIVPYALSDQECNLEIQIDIQNMGSASFVRALENRVRLENIHCITLDQWVNDHNITKIDFIKAYIEGAERYMLMGATQVLKKFAPKLSICTYHLPDDPQVLEEIILKANPKYKIKQTSHKLYAYVK